MKRTPSYTELSKEKNKYVKKVVMSIHKTTDFPFIADLPTSNVETSSQFSKKELEKDSNTHQIAMKKLFTPPETDTSRNEPTFDANDFFYQAFQQREAQVSQELGAENEKLSQALVDSENQLGKEIKIQEELFQYNQELDQTHQEQHIEIQRLQKDNQTLQNRVGRYHKQNEMLQKSIDRLEGMLARLGNLEQQITREINSDSEEDSELY